MDSFVRQFLHAIHSKRGASGVHDAIAAVAKAASRKSRSQVQNWPAYITRILKNTFRHIKAEDRAARVLHRELHEGRTHLRAEAPAFHASERARALAVGLEPVGVPLGFPVAADEEQPEVEPVACSCACLEEGLGPAVCAHSVINQESEEDGQGRVAESSVGDADEGSSSFAALSEKELLREPARSSTATSEGKDVWWADWLEEASSSSDLPISEDQGGEVEDEFSVVATAASGRWSDYSEEGAKHEGTIHSERHTSSDSEFAKEAAGQTSDDDFTVVPVASPATPCCEEDSEFLLV
jgi:hypothetical protein